MIARARSGDGIRPRPQHEPLHLRQAQRARPRIQRPAPRRSQGQRHGGRDRGRIQRVAQCLRQVSAGQRIDARPRLDDEQVVAVAAIDDVVALPAIQRVIAQPARDGVLAEVAVKGIVALVAAQHVVADTPVNRVVARPPRKAVQPVAAPDQVVAGRSQQRVIGDPAQQVLEPADRVPRCRATRDPAGQIDRNRRTVRIVQQIVADPALQQITAGSAPDGVIARIADDRVIPGPADQQVVAAAPDKAVIAQPAIDRGGRRQDRRVDRVVSGAQRQPLDLRKTRTARAIGHGPARRAAEGDGRVPGRRRGIQRIRPRPAEDRVIPIRGRDDEDIVPDPAKEQVVPRPPGKRVIARPTLEGVVAAAAGQRVIPRPGIDALVPNPARDRVVPAAKDRPLEIEKTIGLRAIAQRRGTGRRKCQHRPRRKLRGIQHIIARAAVETVVSIPALQHEAVIPVARNGRVIADPADQDIVARPGIEGIVARSAIQRVVARLAEDRVVARPGQHTVIAIAAEDVDTGILAVGLVHDAGIGRAGACRIRHRRDGR